MAKNPQPPLENVSPSAVFAEWQTIDSHPHERSNRWYMIGGIFVIMGAAYGLYEGSWALTLVSLLIGATYFLLRNVEPNQLIVRITGIGISINGDIFPWNQYKDFWIVVERDFTELHLGARGVVKGDKKVFIKDPNTQLVLAPDAGILRELLLNFLPERPEMEERILDKIERYLKL